MPVTPSAMLDHRATRVTWVVITAPGADEVACQHVSDVLRIWSLPEQVVDLAGFLVCQIVESLTASAQGSLGLAVEVTTARVTVTVTGRAESPIDDSVVDQLGWGPDVLARWAVTSGVLREDSTTSAWFSLARGGASPSEPVGDDEGVRNESDPRLQTLVRITRALAEAETLAAVTDGIPKEIRAYLGAAFTGIALLDPLAAGCIRYVSMDPFPAETDRDWAEIPLADTSPVGAAVAQGRPTYFSSRSAAEQSFPGIEELMRIAGVGSMAHVPLSADGVPIGTMAVSWAEEHGIDVQERAMLATVAAYTAVAVARCRRSVDEPDREPPAPSSLADASRNGSAAPIRSTPEPSTASEELRPLRVLLVDDTDDIRELLAGLFARRPDAHVVAGARDGQEAIDLAAALQPDIVVLDVAMPVLDGISALPRLVAAAPHARIVMLSALPAGLRAPVALAGGAMAYVEKTTAVGTLVDDLLEGAKLLDLAVRRLTDQVDQQLVADPGQVRLARHFVADTLDRWEQSPLADTIVLLLSELVTNAVLHAQSAPRVSVRLLPDRVHVEVTDRDFDAGQALPPTADQTSGRGLAMVESLSMGWGTALLPHGKVVWFDVARAS